jgi:hypothetical protein
LFAFRLLFVAFRLLLVLFALQLRVFIAGLCMAARSVIHKRQTDTHTHTHHCHHLKRCF